MAIDSERASPKCALAVAFLGCEPGERILEQLQTAGEWYFTTGFKRLDPELFVATRATWGLDTRNAACRAILNVGEAGARMGEQIAFVVPHCDPTANLHEKMYACRGGEVVEIWTR